jgi:hypothetical protein
VLLVSQRLTKASRIAVNDSVVLRDRECSVTADGGAVLDAFGDPDRDSSHLEAVRIERLGHQVRAGKEEQIPRPCVQRR